MADVIMTGPIRRRLSERVRERIIAAAVARGADEAKVREVVNDLESERPILDWLMNGGLEALIKFIMELIALLG